MWVFESLIPAGWQHNWAQCTAIPTPHSASPYSSVTTAPSHFSLHSWQLVASRCLCSTAPSPWLHQDLQWRHRQASVEAMTMILGTSSFLNWLKGLTSPLCLDGDWNRSWCENHWDREWQLRSRAQTKFHPSFLEERLPVVSVLAQNAPVRVPVCFIM